MSVSRPWNGGRRRDDEEFWDAATELACALNDERGGCRNARIEHILMHFPEPCPEATAENIRRDAVRQLLATWVAGPIETEKGASIERLLAELEGQLQIFNGVGPKAGPESSSVRAPRQS